jgi:hypothetical protein
MNEQKVLTLIDHIQHISKHHSGTVSTNENIPEVNLIQYELINTIINELNLNTYDFTKIFNDNISPVTFGNELKFTPKFKQYLIQTDECCFKFKNNTDEFLCYLGKTYDPNYIWKLSYIIPEIEEEPEEEPEEEEF